MLNKINRNPFPVRAHFDFSLVLTFAYDISALKNKIPPELELDTYENRWAFLAVAMVQTKSLRPKGFPRFLGTDFFLIGYRIFVRYRSIKGNRMRGLYILKSETDKQRMQFLGNIFTRYRYSKTDIQHSSVQGGAIAVSSKSSNFQVEVDTKQNPELPLPDSSPFPTWQKARLFSGPLPFTFSIDRVSQEIVIVEGVRESWSPQPVQVVNYSIPFLQEFSMDPPLLANAFVTRDIPYDWKRGRTESLSNED